MKEETENDLFDHLQAKFDALPAGTVVVPQAKNEGRNPLGPHRRRDESWEHYIDRRINDAPVAY